MMTDLRFARGLFNYLDKSQQRAAKVLLVILAGLLVIILGFGLGFLTKPDAPVVVDSRQPLKRVEEPLPYVPLPPTLAWPARGAITAGFGARTPAQARHTGIDIGGKHGDPITPFRAGRVSVVERNNSNPTGLGKYVTVDHGDNLTSVYGHLSSITVSVGQNVTTQTIIGKEGSTGEAYGTHLHLEIRVNDKPVDPRKYIPGTPPH